MRETVTLIGLSCVVGTVVASPVTYNDADGATFVRSSADGFADITRFASVLPSAISTTMASMGSVTATDNDSIFVDNTTIPGVVSSTTGFEITATATTAIFHYEFDHSAQLSGNGGSTGSDGRAQFVSTAGPLYIAIIGSYAAEFSSPVGGRVDASFGVNNSGAVFEEESVSSTAAQLDFLVMLESPIDVSDFDFSIGFTAFGDPAALSIDAQGSNGTGSGWLRFIFSTEPIPAVPTVAPVLACSILAARRRR